MQDGAMAGAAATLWTKRSVAVSCFMEIVELLQMFTEKCDSCFVLLLPDIFWND
jgi:hypothetical protein